MNARVVPEPEAAKPVLAAFPKLHFGCFDRPLEGWVNTDITPHIWISRVPFAAKILNSLGKISSERLSQHETGIFRQIKYLNVCKPFPYPSSFFEAAFSSHVLEHLYPSVAIDCVTECLRVLRPNGVLRIAVPDLDGLVRSYDPSNADLFLQSVFQYEVGAEKNSHHWHYNYANLRFLLLKVGFSRVTRCEFGTGACPDVERIDNRPGSLFVEAFK